MNWNNITVGQFIQLTQLASDKSTDDFEKAQRAVCIVFDKTEQQIDKLTYGEYKQMEHEAVRFMKEKMPETRSRYIYGSKRKYKLIYDLSQMEYRQYVELIHFGEKPVENMNLILASVVKPVGFLGMVKRNDAEKHSEYAEDLLGAPVVAVYNACVFFCKLFAELMRSIRDYLVSNIVQTKKMTKQEAEELLNNSINAMDGFSQPLALQTTKG